MNHKPVILDGDELLTCMVQPECGWDDQQIADTLGLQTSMEYDEYDTLYASCPAPKGYWVVTWPEHVITPKYNSDANYHGPYESMEIAQKQYPDAMVWGQPL